MTGRKRTFFKRYENARPITRRHPTGSRLLSLIIQRKIIAIHLFGKLCINVILLTTTSLIQISIHIRFYSGDGKPVTNIGKVVGYFSRPKFVDYLTSSVKQLRENFKKYG
jgi:hypothetical protein